MTKGNLVKSKWTSGRWCIGNNELSCGYPISVDIDGEWIQGRVEHNGKCYYFLADGLKMNLSQDLYVRDDYKR